MNFIKITKFNIQLLIKILLRIIIISSFGIGFYKIYISLPPKLYLQLIFLLTYAWFTIGINVNLIMPLLKIIDSKIKK